MTEEDDIPEEGSQFKWGAFATVIKELRKSRGLTQTEAARLIGAGSHRAWAAYEDGDRSPSFEQAFKMVTALGFHFEVVIESVEARRDRLEALGLKDVDHPPGAFVISNRSELKKD